MFRKYSKNDITSSNRAEFMMAGFMALISAAESLLISYSTVLKLVRASTILVSSCKLINVMFSLSSISGLVPAPLKW